ncbi:phytoene desaturase family protein [Candidatus Pelagibacter sp.]|jgi:phytoene desaturase|uniref:phytoene desaturase family protein n=1 Tax=uncultured Candidatus Pelagibacter sp. TaxID=372654 RepID=UPI00233AC5A9|nr:phytoene desaturase family protein [uncultured Candidatus Pelagibacter sp.]MDB3969836.1 phytoene desaturase family protein [Candidatus Pelagibacter sp.]MDB4811750.1 phytoene desaturase family protein [Candidatus Pelagibacter sp.]MDC0465328.1 phytoene desaturase family protein [Candidatus Pelagibacter sp.]MDC1003929.1 phytoene desaturase family protein [Candidatus Pelagibacter sp.]MDC1076890.1 phytoene desaturase family protein [Candidatus Pelagibacter sp.]
MNSIVIGSGFGGIAAALRLKAKGHQVTLVEKHPDLGGRARVFKKNGFTFDGGPTVITAPYLINELFDLFKKDPKDYIELTPLKIWYQFIFEDKTKFNYSGNEAEMESQIQKINMVDVKGYERLVNFTKKIFDKGFTELADVPFDKPFVMMKQLPALLKLKSYKSVYSLVSSYIQSEKLRRMLSMHPLLVGGNPFSTTSIYGLILYLEKKWGIHYSMGGTGNIIKGYEKLMNEVGIKILKESEVTKIISKNNKISGVQINNQINIDTDNVICNADPPAVYEKLLGQNKNDSILFNWKKNRMEYSMGLFVYYFGTKKIYENVEHHTIKFGNKYKEHLDDIFDKKKLNEDISYYLHRPTATDKSMAPEGNDCFYVLVPVPNNQSKINWDIEGEKMKKLVIDKMEKDLMPNLSENIIEDFYLTPDYFEKDLNTKYGSGFSIQPKFTQSAYFRFHNKSEVYDGLYFVGAGTHPGAGVPGVLSSAKVLDKII